MDEKLPIAPPETSLADKLKILMNISCHMFQEAGSDAGFHIVLWQGNEIMTANTKNSSSLAMRQALARAQRGIKPDQAEIEAQREQNRVLFTSQGMEENQKAALLDLLQQLKGAM